MRFYFILCFAILIAGCATVKPADYGVKSSDINSCVQTQIVDLPKKYPPPGVYDQEEVANIYLQYAVAAFNAYKSTLKDGVFYDEDLRRTRFVFGDVFTEWSAATRIERPGGLSLDYYFGSHDPEVFKILIAFRGTQFDSLGDWYANLSWLTQLIPVRNQYDYARESVAEIVKRAKAVANGRKITVLTTGHSLGGGLAEHVAYAFPCTSAIVFDSSFVVNKYRLAEPFDAQVVHIFDRQDELTFLRRLFLSDTETPSYRRYPLDLVPPKMLQHRSEPLGVGMARMVAQCQTDESRTDPPGCRKSDTRARRLYCISGYAEKEQKDPICRF